MWSSNLPFQIVVLTGLSGDPEVPLPRPRDRRLVTLTRGSLPIILKAQRPRLKLRAPGVDGVWTVLFAELADFSEMRIASPIAAAGATTDEARAVAAAVRHDTPFCALCSAWYGLDFLLRATDGKPNVVVSPRNLKYMRAFAETWPDEEFVQAVLAQITWYHRWSWASALHSSPANIASKWVEVISLSIFSSIT